MDSVHHVTPSCGISLTRSLSDGLLVTGNAPVRNAGALLFDLLPNSKYNDNVSYILSCQQDKPIAAFYTDGQSFTDLSPYNNVAGMSLGTLRPAPGVGNGNKFSSVFDKNNIGYIESSIFTPGTESRPFTMETSIVPSSLTEPLNQAINGDFENGTNVPWRIASSTSASITTNWSSTGQSSVDITPTSTNADSYLRYLPDNSVQPTAGNMSGFLNNHTYTVSGTVYLPAAQTGTLDSNGRTRLIEVYGFIGTTATTLATSDPAPNAPGATRLSVTFTIPSNITGMDLRIYNGAAQGGGDVYWDNIVINDITDLTPSTGDQAILATSDKLNGLVINGTIVSFGTSYTNTGSAFATYDIERNTNVNIIGVHTQQRNDLYVNGELVDSADISDEQQQDTYLTSDGHLYIGDTTSTQSIATSSIMIYDYGISADTALKHYSAALSTRIESDVRAAYSGHSIEFDAFNADAYVNEAMGDDFEWYGDGNAVLTDGIVQSRVVNDQWQDTFFVASFNLDDDINTSIYGAMVFSSGTGYTLQCSLDGDTWTDMDKNGAVPIISPGFDPTDQQLLIRINFSASEVEPFVDHLSVRAYRTGATLVAGVTDPDVDSTGGKTMTLTSMSINGSLNYDEYDDLDGVSGNGTITISADTSDSDILVGTEEFWLKRLDNSNITADAGTVFINGIQSSIESIPTGQWSLVHIVKSAPANDPITLAGNLIVGSIGEYPDALTANQISDIYEDYMGTNDLAVTSSGSIGMDSASQNVTFYANTWAISPAG